MIKVKSTSRWAELTPEKIANLTKSNQQLKPTKRVSSQQFNSKETELTSETEQFEEADLQLKSRRQQDHGAIFNKTAIQFPEKLKNKPVKILSAFDLETIREKQDCGQTKEFILRKLKKYDETPKRRTILQQVTSKGLSVSQIFGRNNKNQQEEVLDTQEQELIKDIRQHELEDIYGMINKDQQMIDQMNNFNQQKGKSRGVNNQHRNTRKITMMAKDKSKFLNLLTRDFNYQEIEQERELASSPRKSNYKSPDKSPTRSPFNKIIEEQLNYNKDKDKDRNEFISKYDVAMYSNIQQYSNISSHISPISDQYYYKYYKNQDKMNEFEKIYNLTKSSKRNYLNNYHIIVFQAMPKKLGIITNQPTNNINEINSIRTIQTSNYRSMCLSTFESVQGQQVIQLNLSRNKLNNRSLRQVLTSIPQQLQELNLMNNQITSLGIRDLSDYLQRSYNLRRLNLESNRFGDQGTNFLCDALANNRVLTHLNLSKNNLTSQSSISIAVYIKKTISLTELYLHYNNLGSFGGAQILKGLQRNSTIKVLDLSFNSISEEDECLQVLLKIISKPHPELVHFDISHNKFKNPLEIAKALCLNQNIYGFHFEGNNNDWVVDVNGFLVNYDEQIQEKVTKINEQRKLDNNDKIYVPQELDKIAHQHRDRRINGCKAIVPLGQRYINSLDTCWICEGWQEVKFYWTPGQSGSIEQEPIYLHVDFEDFRPIPLTKLDNQFFLYKMCPPNVKVNYFFSQPLMKIQTTAKDHQSCEMNIPSMPFLYNGDKLIEGQEMSFVNYLYTFLNQVVIDDQKHYLTRVYCRPRDEEKAYDLSQYAPRTKKKWRLEESIFKNYQPDNEDLILECFEFDFETSKINRLVRDEDLDEIKICLEDFYPYLFYAYKYYVSAFVNAAVPCITANSFNDFIRQTRIMEGNKIRSTDIDINFVASNGKDLKFSQLPDKGLVRYQFMEILVRIAIDKYYKSGITESIYDAVEKMIDDDGIKEWLEYFDKSQEWRDERYWNEECDNILQNRLPFLKLLFLYVSQINIKKKYYKFKWVQSCDFRDFLVEANLVNEEFVERDCYLVFLQSMMTQVDELDNARHYQMNFYEFLEGLARVAEKQSLSLKKRLNQQEKRIQPLSKKLEALILLIYYKLGEKIKKVFQESGEDLSEFDNCVLGNKKAKIRGTQVGSALMIKQSNKVSSKRLTLKDNNSSINSSDEENEVESEYCLEDLLDEEEDLMNQLKEQKSSSGQKMNFMQVVRMAKEQKQQKVKNDFTLVSMLRYIKKQEYQYLLEQQQEIDNNI